MNTFLEQIKQRFHLASVVEKIIYINVLLFIVSYPFIKVYGDSNVIFNLFSLPSSLNKLLTKPWSLLSYGFLHGDFWHIAFNMLLLYYLGSLFLDFFSKKQFLTYFFGGIIAGGIIFLISYNFLPALKNKSTMLVGASAGVTAIVVGLATKTPNYAIHFRFIGAIKLWYIAAAIIIIDIVQLPSDNTGGHLAHLGGALLGFSLTNYFNEGKNIVASLSNLFTRKKQKPLKTVYKKTKPTNSSSSIPNQEKIDAILDKISKSGYDTLTKEEKDFLFSASKNK